MRKVFITGGTGFFGKSILDYLKRHPEFMSDVEWTILTRNSLAFLANNGYLVDQARTFNFWNGDVRTFVFPENVHFDAIIHAASVLNPAADETEILSAAVEGTQHVIDFAKAIGCPKILYTSSGAVYGPQWEPSSEETPVNPTTPYARGKIASERFLLESGLDVKIARCFAFVGKYLDRGIYYAIGNFIQDCLDGKPMVIKGDGTPFRSYLYADDLVEWLFSILARGESGRPYNVGSDEAVSIRELAECVKDALGVKNKISVLGTPQSAPPSVYVPVVSRIERELGVRQRVPLLEAIRRSAR